MRVRKLMEEYYISKIDKQIIPSMNTDKTHLYLPAAFDTVPLSNNRTNLSFYLITSIIFALLITISGIFPSMLGIRLLNLHGEYNINKRITDSILNFNDTIKKSKIFKEREYEKNIFN